MTGSDLTRMYEMSYLAIKRNLEDVSHTDSIVAPPNGGNCLNWVLGHVVTTRNVMLQLTGGSPVMTGDAVDVYKRGSQPCGSEGFLDLATLRGLLDDSQQQLLPNLAALSDNALASPVPEPYNRPPLSGSLGDVLGRLYYHEAYHNGQIGLLRRVAGKEGAIK